MSGSAIPKLQWKFHRISYKQIISSLSWHTHFKKEKSYFYWVTGIIGIWIVADFFPAKSTSAESFHFKHRATDAEL